MLYDCICSNLKFRTDTHPAHFDFASQKGVMLTYIRFSYALSNKCFGLCLILI